jgi:hypothetical protein
MAERAVDAVIAGHHDLAAPLAVVIETLDARAPDPDLEDGGDLEEQHDAEGRSWGSGATLDQLQYTYDIAPDGSLRSFTLPADVRGLERATSSLGWREMERQKLLARKLEKRQPRRATL